MRCRSDNELKLLFITFCVLSYILLICGMTLEGTYTINTYTIFNIIGVAVFLYTCMDIGPLFCYIMISIRILIFGKYVHF